MATFERDDVVEIHPDIQRRIGGDGRVRVVGNARNGQIRVSLPTGKIVALWPSNVATPGTWETAT